MIFISEADTIYFSKTREYFKEVLSSYSNGNYRSAVVMLYSVAICDLLFKLQELKDMYNDTVAAAILAEVEKCRNEQDNKSKSRWEKELVDNIYKKTDLLTLEEYTNLNHLYDHRNFSAHPALNERYELISPSQETTIACIKNILEGILVKPPIFIKNITDMLTKDLDERRELYLGKPNDLRNYLNNKYFNRMSLPMKQTVFKAFWKFCFCLPDDPDCMRNIVINRQVLEALLENDFRDITAYIKSEEVFTRTSPNERCSKQLCILLSKYPPLYSILSDDTKKQILSLINASNEARNISWFLCKNKEEHIQKLIEKRCFETVTKANIAYMYEAYVCDGTGTLLLNFCIEYFSNSGSYDGANERYITAIKPFISKMTREQYIKLFETINENSQIHNRNASKSCNTEIMLEAKRFMGSDFDFSQYPNFDFDREKVYGVNHETDTGSSHDIDDDDLPF